VAGQLSGLELEPSALPTKASALKTPFGGFVTRISLGYSANSMAT
jgi:hypothetical protein